MSSTQCPQTIPWVFDCAPTAQNLFSHDTAEVWAPFFSLKENTKKTVQKFTFAVRRSWQQPKCTEQQLQ